MKICILTLSQMATGPHYAVNNLNDFTPKQPPFRGAGNNQLFDRFRRFFMSETQFNDFGNYAMMTTWITKSFLTRVIDGKNVEFQGCEQFQALVRNDGKILSEPVNQGQKDCHNFKYFHALQRGEYLDGVESTGQWYYDNSAK